MTMNIELGGFTFISDFDSGNLGRVELVAKRTNDETPEAEKSPPDEEAPDFEFNLWTQPDCAGTEYENGNRTWFYFGIKGGVPCANMQLNIVDLNKQTKMYSQGMAPVCRVVPGKHHWERIKDKPQFRVVNNVFILTFKYRTPENPRATVYFAFTYPYPYFELQNTLHSVDNRFKHQQPDSRKRNMDLDDIYYHRECVCYSLEGRRVDLITISSHHYITDEPEPRLKYLFPETDHPRPFRFNMKKIVFVSARVHPGETPSSFVISGFLKLLLQRDDPVAVLLRKNFVFKLIPMLNPDGVCNGHYRTDTRGVNLNRVYSSPSFVLHPAIYAARSLILYHHHGQEIEDVITGPVFDPASRKFKSRITPALTESDSAEFSDILSPGAEVLGAKFLDSIHENDADADIDIDVGADADADTASSIENKVSCLTLDEKCDPEDCSNTSKVAPSSPQVDVLSAICEAVIKKVLDMNEIDMKTPETGIGGGREEEMEKEEVIVKKEEENEEKEEKEEEEGKEVNNEPVTNDLNIQDSSPVTNISSEYAQTGEDPLLAQRSETSLSAGSVDSSESNGGYMKSNFPEDTSCGLFKIGDKEKKSVYTAPENSGIFLYLDLHGHASKKGIFMYGNHFDNMNDSVECMLLPKIMSINNANFHFTACNFTERNMYLRDRKDGSSREGCGRVSVLKATGLVRSYTLECNYNTGRIVNVVPQCVRDFHKPNPTLLVPPKYTPHVFEEIGQAIGASILDLTGTHPWSRIPNSEFRTLNGIRDWLRGNCVPEQMYIHKTLQQNNKNSNSRRQVVCVTGASVRMSRPARAAANGCKVSRHETKRRLAPLSKAAKVAGCSNSALDSANKSEDEGSSSGIDFDRKENVTSFQIISPPQSPKHMKLNKSTSNPKENVSPSSSQKISNTSKKLKAVTGVGVLKQVLAVRAKCTSVSAGAGSPKVRSTTGLKIHKASLHGSNLQKSRRVPYNNCIKCATSDTQISSDHTHTEGFKSTGTQAVVDQSGDTTDIQNVERKNSDEKTKYIKDESKGIIKHGPKRLKVSSGKAELHSALAQKSGANKLTLKEICYLNLRKQKKKLSKLAMLNDSIVENPSSSSDKTNWNHEHNPRVVPLRTTRQNSVNSKNKLVHKNVNSNSISKCPISAVKNVKISNPGPSSNIKVKACSKSEKLLKSKVPHLSPIKTHKISPSLGRKVSTDTGKKWGKASLKTIATSFGKLRALTGDIVYIEMKRKKSKVKH